MNKKYLMISLLATLVLGGCSQAVAEEETKTRVEVRAEVKADVEARRLEMESRRETMKAEMEAKRVEVSSIN